MMESSTYGSGDLYVTNNREMVAQELTARAEAERAELERRRTMMESYYSGGGMDYSSIVAADYESAYARRLYGFNSPTYRLPASYYDLATSDAMRYASAYDPAFYNIMLSGDQVWVEPKYVTSMFGTWGATNVTFGIYSSPWMYGWGGYSSPFYCTMWGYPHYSWYDWSWNMCYNPYHWGFGYYAGYYPHYHGHYPHHPAYPPHYNPGKPGAGDRYHTSERRNSASRYSSPTATYSSGGRTSTTVRNSGARSSGVNGSRVSSGSTSGSRSSSTTRSSSTSRSSSSSSSSSSGRTYRSSSTSVGGTVSSSSSSTSRSSSSTSRSSGSTSSSRSSSRASSRR